DQCPALLTTCATHLCPSVPPSCTHQCRLPCPPSVSIMPPISAAQQCRSSVLPSVLPISAASSVPPHQCRLSMLPISASYQCPLSVPISAAYPCHLISAHQSCLS
ncbi:unnamed protein product, partial [Staurois parvus]